jgi:hypothetical protein
MHEGSPGVVPVFVLAPGEVARLADGYDNPEDGPSGGLERRATRGMEAP